MKNINLVAAALFLLILTACGGHREAANDDGTYTLPPAGTIVAVDSMETNEKLNHFSFTVSVVANDNTKYGVYDVKAKYGPNTAEGQFTMPRGGEHQKPLLRKGKSPGTYIVGFRYGSDTTFYEYYQVASVSNGPISNIEMKYLKAYSFK